MATIDLDAITRDRERIKKEYLVPEGERPESSARGIACTGAGNLGSVDIHRARCVVP